MTESRLEYRTSTQPPQFHTITVTLSEHQLLKRVRQLANLAGSNGRAIILVLEIASDNVGELTAARRL